MLIVELRFPGGRFHATPWGRHVNEGVVEWPPSPWRFLRALVATWKRACPELSVATVSPVLAALAAPPEFRLPRASIGHTRHFMPDRVAHRDKVFDTFVAFQSDQPVQIIWRDLTLPPSQLDILRTILGRVPYFGRAESWCEMSIGAAESRRADYSTAHLGNGGPDTEAVRVLVAEEWPNTRPVDSDHPLLIDTTRLRDELRRRDPPGSRWLIYQRGRQSLTPTQSRLTRNTPLVHVMRFALDARPLPLVAETLAVAEGFRLAALSRYGGKDQRGSEVLSGHTASGERVQGHTHARYLPTGEDAARDRLSHVTIVASAGLDGDHQAALARISYVIWGDRRESLATLFLGSATLPEVQTQADLPLFAKSTAWVSSTPYMLARHPHREKDSPQDQLRRELELRFPGVDVQIEPVTRDRRPRWTEFRRWRSRGPQPAVRQAYGFRLRFAENVSGPLAFGYGSHFGLGLFLPET